MSTKSGEAEPPPLKKAKTAAAWTPLKGILTPLMTPLLDQDTIDKPGTRKLIEHVLEGGVSGIFLLGSSGEGPSLSQAARKEVVEFGCEVVAQRVPVLVGISDTALGETVALAQVAHQAGATAVVLTQPYYYTMGQTEMIAYVEQVLQAIDLPIMLYNIPFLTKSCWDVETVHTLAKRHARIVGLKDTGGDLPYFEKLCATLKKDLPEFTIMIGPEHLLPEAIAAGGDGGIVGGSNVIPEVFSSLYQTIVAADDEDDASKKKKIQALTEAVKEFQEIYTLGNLSTEDHPFSRFIAGLKCGLAAKEICGMYVNPPFSGYGETQLAQAKGLLSRLEEKLKEL